jgi:hypothetical protein
MDRQRFEHIKELHGSYASWAVWAEVAEKPKSNVGDLSVLDPDINPALLSLLREDVVMVGLNFSRSVLTEPFRNFHDPSGRAHDFKIRYAFRGTEYYGAYMTDIIKNFPMLKSGDLRKHLTPSLIRENTDTFLRELSDLGTGKPTTLAFGLDAYRLIAKWVPAAAYGRLVKVTHYSNYISKEQYREKVSGELTIGDAQPAVPADAPRAARSARG